MRGSTRAQAQLDTAKALFERTSQQLKFGRAAQIDVNRSQVEVLLNQQRLVTLQNDLAKQKINLARVTGLPPTADYDLSNVIPFAPAPPLNVEDAIKQALAQRSDLKAAETQVRAAERALAAARAERYPSASASADYGDHRHAFLAAPHLYGLGHAERAHLERRAHSSRHSTGAGRPFATAGRTRGHSKPDRKRSAQRLPGHGSGL